MNLFKVAEELKEVNKKLDTLIKLASPEVIKVELPKHMDPPLVEALKPTEPPAKKNKKK